MGVIIDWLFRKLRQTPQPRYESPLPGRTDKRRTARKQTKSTSLKLIESHFDPDGDAGDGVEWFGFLIQDERGLGIRHAEAEDFNLKVFRVAGVTYRKNVLQKEEFKPGETLTLIPEPTNHYDRNAIGVWDSSGKYMLGYVPKGMNRRVLAALSSASYKAMVLGEHRKDGKRVSVTVLFGPIGVNFESGGPA